MLALCHALLLADADDVATGVARRAGDEARRGRWLQSVADAKSDASNGKCLAFTFAVARCDGSVHVYFKQDTTVAESDKTWSSFIKRPAGLMDVASHRSRFPPGALLD